MKKLFVLTIALVFVAILVVQQSGAQQVSARIWTRGAFGNGLAISQSDPMDFELIRIGVAGVKITMDENETIRKIGILHFGEDKYSLRDVVMGNGSVTADIYYNASQVGSLALDAYVKGDREMWAGTMTLNGENYNAYVIHAPRILRPVEKARRIHEYCKNNPVRCRAVMKAVGNIICDPEAENVTCRDKIQTFCEENPDDNRCKALRLAYCKTHLEDSACRAEIRGVCENNATENACNVLGEVYNRNIEKNPQVVRKAPRWLITVRNRILSPQAGA